MTAINCAKRWAQSSEATLEVGGGISCVTLKAMLWDNNGDMRNQEDEERGENKRTHGDREWESRKEKWEVTCSLAQLDKLKLTAHMIPKFFLPEIDRIHAHNLVLKEGIGGSIPSCEISSLLDRKLVRWSTTSCALALACRHSVSK